MQYILQLIFLILLIITIFSFASLAPWVPTKKKDLARINKITDLKENENFLEIGCGTGLVSIYIAKNNPKSKIVGIELSPFFYIISFLKAKLNGLKNIEIKYGNALKKDLSKYDVIYIFGLPETISNKLFPKLQNIKSKKFRLVSYCFKMTNDFFSEEKFKTKGDFAIYKYYISDK